jgi:prepilin-type N-terminal cleavage/methylation domain-containing protein
MQRSPFSRAFTLIEMITVIAIITILASLVIGLSSLVINKGYRARAETERIALASACEAYRTDNGEYPQTADTDALNPRTSMNPSAYAAASLALYKLLSGDTNANGVVDSSETPHKYAGEFFKPSRFNSSFKTTGTVTFIVDPFGNPYGYSTAGLKAEQDFRSTGSRDSSKGYNPTFDIWSTGGGITADDKGKWIKNW